MCFSMKEEKTIMLQLLVLLLVSHGVGKVRCTTVHENNIDFHSLFDFKNNINNDPYGALNNWTIGTHFCRWNGISCSSTRPRRVIRLNLSNCNLAGHLTSSLGNLTSIKDLDLSNNSLVGPLPLLNKLEQLELLHLDYNLFHGTIPDVFTNSSRLKKLDLSSNYLVGAIPPNLGADSNRLIALGLTSNNLSGSIPPALGNISTLQGLYLNINNLDGNIPHKIWELPNLVQLYLNNNGLSGGIPQTLPHLSHLEVLALEFNKLEKELPSNIAYALPSLQNLSLAHNMFVGRIPSSLGNISGLLSLDLSANKFSGQVPASFGRLSTLEILNLGTNNLEASDNLSWEFIYALRKCRNLRKLSLAENHLQGHIPDSIGDLSSSLEYLAFGSNNLSGIVPPSIQNLHGLIWLSLDHNKLTGTIEEWIGNLKNLQVLYLETNDFVGSIPSSIGNLKNLTQLLLHENNFEGGIPPSIGNLSRLQKLDLSYNYLHGDIPLEITNLIILIWVNLSSNNLTGEIPRSFDNCKSLADIRMDQNILTGYIPASLGNLDSLTTLNLSHNDLSGTIPTKLSSLSILDELDLSYNRLHGAVPTNGVFANANDVALFGNLELCGGVTDLHMPPCPTVSSKKDKRLYLIKVLIPTFGFLSLLVLICFVLLEKKRPRRNYPSLPFPGEHFHKVSYNDLAQATRNFSESNLIGRGSYGTVYRGKLKESKMEVAIKVFDLEMHGAERSFLAECEALRSIQHRNLLSILTACSTVDNTGNVFKALVYEFMPNGNLDTWLHHREDDKDPKHLGLTQRINIAVNIADAMDYLHHDCGRPTIHCDLKPSNILLDDDMNALLGDFGIARFYPGLRVPSMGSIGIKGTIGYIAPEYGQGGHASTSGDVYSFGIVLLEIITGKRPTDPVFNDGLDIIKFVDSNFPQTIRETIDPLVLEECGDFDQANIESESAVGQLLVSLLQVALSCARPLPNERMNMKQVASKMHAIRASYLLACKAK